MFFNQLNNKGNLAGIDVNSINEAKQKAKENLDKKSESYDEILREGLFCLKKAIVGQNLEPNLTQKAISHFIKATELKKMNPEPYFYLSYIALLCDDKELSIKYLKITKEIKSDFSGIQNLENRLNNMRG